MLNKVLLIEDEVSMRMSLKKLLELKKFQVEEAESIKNAEKKLDYYDYDVFLLDLRLPDGSGLDVLKKYKTKMEGKTIIITAHATIASAVDAVQNGAFYYLEKPLDEELLFIQMERIMEICRLKERNLSFKNELIQDHAADDIIYKSDKMAEVLNLARQFARGEHTVLLQGQTGVGKEVIAKFIHQNSPRRDKIFLPINCSSIPENLFESELFGFKKGAFTGAGENYQGRFVQADKGTLFLDEIGEMPLHLQAKLLRVLEDGVIYQLGNTVPKTIDIRLIAASNKDIEEEAEAGNFRKDLYFRLKGCLIHIPPLRERREDIMPLVRHFIAIYNNLFDKKVSHITQEAEVHLNEYAWDGNIRELKNAVKSIMAVKTNHSISLKDIIIALHGGKKQVKKSLVSLEEHELAYIKEVCTLTGFNLKKTAEILDISRSKLYRKLKLLDIDSREKMNMELND